MLLSFSGNAVEIVAREAQVCCFAKRGAYNHPNADCSEEDHGD